MYYYNDSGVEERVDVVDKRNAGAVTDMKGCLDYEYMYDEMILLDYGRV